MERKKTAEKTKANAKSKETAHSASHSQAKQSSHKTAEAKTTHRKPTAHRNHKTNETERTYTVISNEPQDMAVLSETQQAEVFDMYASENPLSDSQAVRDARVQAALEPVGTNAAIEPIITEDGVIIPYSR